MKENPILDEILELSREQRLSIAAAIWDSLVTESDQVPIPEWHRNELAARLSAEDRDMDPGESWAELRRRIEAES